MVQTLSDQPVPPTYIAQLSGLNIELSCEFGGDGFLLLPSNGLQSLKCVGNGKKKLQCVRNKNTPLWKMLEELLKVSVYPKIDNFAKF